MNAIKQFFSDYKDTMINDCKALYQQTDQNTDADEIIAKRIVSIALRIIGAYLMYRPMDKIITAVFLGSTKGVTLTALAALGLLFVVGHDLIVIGINDSRIINSETVTTGIFAYTKNAWKRSQAAWTSLVNWQPERLAHTWLAGSIYDFFR